MLLKVLYLVKMNSIDLDNVLVLDINVCPNVHF